jgi:hypothetical protein
MMRMDGNVDDGTVCRHYEGGLGTDIDHDEVEMGT